MRSRAEVVEAARAWIGSAWQHRGRLRGASCDCIGLVIGVCRDLGLPCPAEHEIPAYGRFPAGHLAQTLADRLMVPAGDGWEAVRPGRVGLFWWRQRGHGQHFAIFAAHKGRMTMIHAYQGLGRVTEQGVSDFWRGRLLRVYDLVGVG